MFQGGGRGPSRERTSCEPHPFRSVPISNIRCLADVAGDQDHIRCPPLHRLFLLTSLELLDMLSQLRCKCPQVETPKPKLEIRSYTQVPTSRDPKTETRNPKSLNPKPFTKGLRSSGLLGSGSIEFYHYPKKSKNLSPKHPQNLPIGPKVVPFWDSLIEF